MDLVNYNDPILTTPSKDFDFLNPPFDAIEFAKEIVKVMRDKSGLGLAAPQVGVPYRICAVRADPNKVLYNPKIVWYSDDKILMEEGCLSTPGLAIKIERSKHIKVRYFQPNSEVVTETYTGMTARIIQHECNHLDGILFTHLVSKLKLDRALRKCMKEFGIKYKFSDLCKKSYEPEVYIPEDEEEEKSEEIKSPIILVE